jgi:hypothetical protein
MPRPRLHSLLALALLLPAAACGRDEQPIPPSITEAFAELPFPPKSSFVSRSGGQDVLTISLRSGEKYEAVLAYYRDILDRAPWHILSDARDPEEGQVIYAERDGRPLWVRLRPEGSAWTLVDLTGGVPRGVPDPLQAPGDTAAGRPGGQRDSAVLDQAR